VSGKYEFWLTSDTGARLSDRNGNTLLDSALWLLASRADSKIGSFRLGLPVTFDTGLLRTDRLDRMFQLWRAPAGGRLSLWRVYFVRWWRYETIGARQTLVIGGPDVNDLLRRRNVIAYAGSEEAGKTDFADDMAKEIVTESIADGVEPVPDAGTRVWADLSIAPDLGNGPTITKAFAFKKLLTEAGWGVLAEIKKASREAGTEIFFDIVPSVVTGSSINFEFRTYTGQPGSDVSNRVVFDQQRGNLQAPFLEYDFTRELNYVYGAGQGEGAARNVQQEYDAARYGSSQWARIEAVADARNQTSDNGVREAARALLEQGRPERRFGDSPVDTLGTRFGVDWNFGDRVRARYRGQEFDTIIRAVSIGLDDRGRETIGARLDFRE